MERAFERLAGLVGQGDYFSRADLAEKDGRDKTTALIAAIEQAVDVGLLHRCWGWVGIRRGWVYATPETMPYLVGLEGDMAVIG